MWDIRDYFNGLLGRNCSSHAAGCGETETYPMSRRANVETTIGLIAAGVFALVGAALVAMGAYVHHQRSTLFGDGLRTTGVIVGFERIGGRGGPGTLTDSIPVPLVRFSTASGHDVTFLGSVDAKPPWADYVSGGRVDVVYDPMRPEDARIDTFAEIWFAPLMLWLIGGSALLIPPFTIWRHLRSTNRALRP